MIDNSISGSRPRFKLILNSVILSMIAITFASAGIGYYILQSSDLAKKLVIIGLFALLIWIAYLPVIRKVNSFTLALVHLITYVISLSIMVAYNIGLFLFK